MKKWISIVLMIALLGGMTGHADVLDAAALETIAANEARGAADGLDIEVESPEPDGDGGLSGDDLSLVDFDLSDLERDAEPAANEYESDLSAFAPGNRVNPSAAYGVWEGKYTARQNGSDVEAAIRLDIDNVAGGAIEGIATIDGGRCGSYFFDGTLDAESGRIEFSGTDWIDQPGELGFFSFSGTLNELERTIEGAVDGDGNNILALRKASDAYASRRIDPQAVPRNWKGEFEARRNAAAVRLNYEMHIQSVDQDGGIAGVAHIASGAKAGSRSGTDGTYYFSGVIDARRGKITIRATEWISFSDPAGLFGDLGLGSLEGWFDSSLSSIAGSAGDGAWRAQSYDSALYGCRSNQPTYPIVIGNNHGSEGVFNESLERYIANMDSGKYYPDLAYMLMALAGAAYNDTGTQGGALTAKNAGYQSESRELYHITKAYEDLGFADYQTYNYYNDPDDPAYGVDNAAFTIGRKQLSDDEALVLVVVRGSYGGISDFTSDWQSNVKLMTDLKGRHLGFSSAANKVYSTLKAFLQSRQYSDEAMKSNVRYVITGHSRGAAVANLLAVRLHEAGVPNSRVYDYNFSCPDTVRRSKQDDLQKDYENIFNICNSADAVAVLPGIVGDAIGDVGNLNANLVKAKANGVFSNWDKYGTTRFYCKDWNDEKEFDLLRTFDVSNSPHDYKYYVPDIGKNTYGFYTRSEIAARRVELGVVSGIDSIIAKFYPEYAATPEDIAQAKVTVESQVYTGKALKPEVKVVLNGKTLQKDADYTVTYKNNRRIGKASVTVKGTGNYQGTRTVSFKINPRRVTGLKLTAGKGKLTANWNKAAGIDGYQLQYSLKETFASAKKVAVGKASTVKKAIKGLKKGKVYYLRIRAYRKVDGKTYWSAWSGAKKVKVK